MGTIKAVFDYTLREHVRHKFWLSTALFGLILLAGALVTSTLAQGERARMMLDLGLAANEAIALILVVFLTVHLILQEIESRTVFLILTHPVRRCDYLLGRFFGTLAAVGLAMAGMGLLHWGMMKAAGWPIEGSYLLAWSCSFGKVAIMGALSMLLSLALTSEAAAMSFATFLWVLGHFTAEIRFLADKSANTAVRAFLTIASRAVPDFAHLNYRDAVHVAAPSAGWMGAAALYVLGYCAACLALSVQVFEQKEF